jgi:8-oxo-dGTP pyrophosphatase MutT (NUDIX family)
MIKIRILNESIVTEQEKITLSQIVGDNSVISFDFDNTLVKSFPDIDDGEVVYVSGGSNATMINLMKQLISDQNKKVYLVTSRSEAADEKAGDQSVKSQLEKLGVRPDGIFFTNSQPKVTKLKDLGVEIHFDDDRAEHQDIQGSGIQSFYPDDFVEDTNQVSKVIAVTLDNKVLILKRADTGEFDIPGGHGKSGETPEFTAIRETLEETGLDLYGMKQIKTKNVEFKGRKEDITYLYAKLNNTSAMLKDDIDLDIQENTEFYFVEPQNIDDYMSNATNNLKNVGNEIKSLTVDEQSEPFQRKMAAKHRNLKKRLIGLGGNKKKEAPYNQNPSFTRSKSAPPGFGGALQEMLTEIEFDLSKFTMRDQLCPNFWQNEKLNSEIRKKLLEIAEDFVKDTPIEGRVDDITFTGSLAGYNYSDSSDIDLHILVDFNKDDDLIKDLMNALRINWNNSHDIRIVGHEVEIYVQDSNEKHYSSGVYSISDDEWLQKPSKDSPEIDTSAVLKKAEGLSDEIDALQNEFNEEKYEKVHNSVQRLRKKLKNMRSAGLEDEGIYSIENLAFKLLRNSGQISKLMTLGNDSYDKMMGFGQKDKKIRIKVKINQNLDEKRKKKRKKRKKSKKRRYSGVYYPYGGLQDTFGGGSGGDVGGDGGGGE